MAKSAANPNIQFNEYMDKMNNMELGLHKNNTEATEDNVESDTSSSDSDHSYVVETPPNHRDSSFLGSIKKSFSSLANKVFGGKNSQEAPSATKIWCENEKWMERKKNRKKRFHMNSQYKDEKIRKEVRKLNEKNSDLKLNGEGDTMKESVGSENYNKKESNNKTFFTSIEGNRLNPSSENKVPTMVPYDNITSDCKRSISENKMKQSSNMIGAENNAKILDMKNQSTSNGVPCPTNLFTASKYVLNAAKEGNVDTKTVMTNNKTSVQTNGQSTIFDKSNVQNMTYVKNKQQYDKTKVASIERRNQSVEPISKREHQNASFRKAVNSIVPNKDKNKSLQNSGCVNVKQQANTILNADAVKVTKSEMDKDSKTTQTVLIGKNTGIEGTEKRLESYESPSSSSISCSSSDSPSSSSISYSSSDSSCSNSSSSNYLASSSSNTSRSNIHVEKVIRKKIAEASDAKALKKPPLDSSSVQLLPSGNVLYFGNEYSLHFLKSVVPFDQYQDIVSIIVQQERTRREKQNRDMLNGTYSDMKNKLDNKVAVDKIGKKIKAVEPKSLVNKPQACAQASRKVNPGLKSKMKDCPKNDTVAKKPAVMKQKAADDDNDEIEEGEIHKKIVLNFSLKDFVRNFREEVQRAPIEDRPIMKEAFFELEKNIEFPEAIRLKCLEELDNPGQGNVTSGKLDDKSRALLQPSEDCAGYSLQPEKSETIHDKSQATKSELATGLKGSENNARYKVALNKSQPPVEFNKGNPPHCSTKYGINKTVLGSYLCGDISLKDMTITSTATNKTKPKSISKKPVPVIIAYRTVAVNTHSWDKTLKPGCYEETLFSKQKTEVNIVQCSMDDKGRLVFPDNTDKMDKSKASFVVDKTVQTKPIRNHAIFGALSRQINKKCTYQVTKQRSPSPVEKQRPPSPVDLQEYINKQSKEKKVAPSVKGDVSEEDVKKYARKMGKNGKKIEKRNKKK